jgi:hypothetical protein
MKSGLAKAIGGAGLRPVQFGIPPNCERKGNFLLRKTFCALFVSRNSVSGATPKTTGGTPVPPV